MSDVADAPWMGGGRATRAAEARAGESRSRDVSLALAPPAPRVPSDSGAAAEAGLRLKLGCTTFEKVNWALSSAEVRERALLLLLAVRGHVPKRWWWDTLLGAAAEPLLATPLHEETLEQLMQAHAAPPLGSDPVAGALPAAQSLLLFALVERRRSGHEGEVSSLLELGMRYFLWQRVGVLM